MGCSSSLDTHEATLRVSWANGIKNYPFHIANNRKEQINPLP